MGGVVTRTGWQVCAVSGYNVPMKVVPRLGDRAELHTTLCRGWQARAWCVRACAALR